MTAVATLPNDPSTSSLPSTKSSTTAPQPQTPLQLFQNFTSAHTQTMSQTSRKRASHNSSEPVAPRSRPQSHNFPKYTSSLPYTLVRDFAWPVDHVLHYGTAPEPSAPPSEVSTPMNESGEFIEERMPWESWKSDRLNRGGDIPPPMHFGDGPPYSEDEDLQSPVVATRHRRQKSSDGGKKGRGSVIDPANYDSERGGYYVGTSGDGSERYYVSQGGEADGPGGDIVTYPPDHSRHGNAPQYGQQQQAGANRSASDDNNSPSSPNDDEVDESRYSRDYKFTITSPDEAFHGKAVALYDFVKENENELQVAEGQIIWVSYRHGHGWLVAEDPKSNESGLVPEEYVRLLRDIKGGMKGMEDMDDVEDQNGSSDTPNEAGTSPESKHDHANGYHQPVVSTFSTSSKDLDPYPRDQLGLQAGQAPPHVVHYSGQPGGSHANANTSASSNTQDSGELLGQDSFDAKAEGRTSASRRSSENDELDDTQQ